MGDIVSNPAYFTMQNLIDAESDFDGRLEMRILAAKLRLRVGIEILTNRAQRDLQLQVHHIRRALFNHQQETHHAEL